MREAPIRYVAVLSDGPIFHDGTRKKDQIADMLIEVIEEEIFRALRAIHDLSLARGSDMIGRVIAMSPSYSQQRN